MDSASGQHDFCQWVEIPTVRVARAVGVDRRTVCEAIRAMDRDRKDKTVFSKLESAGPSIRAAANQLGLGVVEITADNPSEIRILANASTALVDHGISIRQRWSTTLN